ncbi:hypothetical protein SAMN05216475_3808 [Pseudomonas synxantha]|uniref:Uncharacterized protein n=1 Tax=Pseudomonas synxantha TaxID=47883 RepID=A0AAX3ICS5_9PSED|nr:hypothetical protein C4K01_1617 [Pseudomonas synxantha]MDQ0979634.1 hypothetical protein [Pseudomonas synxantha]SDU48940.1 hypothetical protein SAMN05216475_3808 [Pseudomonas synxantha]VTR03301.1 Uncharacterised protein [Pseudomonas synxantha]
MFKATQNCLDKLMGSFGVFFGNIGCFIVKIPQGCP